MNSQDSEFEVPTFGSCLTCISYVLVQGVIALLGMVPIAIVTAWIIGLVG